MSRLFLLLALLLATCFGQSFPPFPNGVANIHASIAGPATTSGAIDITAMNLTTQALLNTLVVECWTGTGITSGEITGNLTSLACVLVRDSNTSVHVTYSSSSNVLVVLNSNGGSGNMRIGGPIVSGAAGRVLYSDASGNLAQNANFLIDASLNGAYGNIASLAPTLLETATGLAVVAQTSGTGYDYNTFLSYTIVDNGARPYPSIFASEIRSGGTGSDYNIRSEMLIRNGASGMSLWDFNMANFGNGTSSISDLAGSVFSASLTGVTVSGDIAAFWARPVTSATSIGGKVVAFLNDNYAVCGATGGCFGWYGLGGTWHQETGAASTIGFEIERATAQTADLTVWLDSDGTTKLNSVPAGGIGKASTGVRYVCVDTAGKLVSQAAACSGT